MAQAALGLYQFIFKVGPEGFLLFGGNFLRAYGTFAQPNPYAGYLGLGLPLALSLRIWGAQPGRVEDSVWPHALNRRFMRVAILSVPLALMLAALFASQSRGAWLGFAGAAAVTVVVRSQKAALSVAGLFVVVALVGLVNSFDVSVAGAGDDSSMLGAVTGRFANAADIFTVTDVATTPVTDANFATIERLAHWQAAQEMWRDNLWLGVGFGNYAVVYPAYAVGRWLDPLGHAHNYLLNLGAETGLAGILAYAIFWFWVFTVSFLAVRRSRGFYRAVAAGGIGVLAHLHIHNMVDNLYVQGMYLHIGIIIGLVSTIYLAQKHSPKIENPHQ
jgi:O-antigen ligase